MIITFLEQHLLKIIFFLSGAGPGGASDGVSAPHTYGSTSMVSHLFQRHRA